MVILFCNEFNNDIQTNDNSNQKSNWLTNYEASKHVF